MLSSATWSCASRSRRADSASFCSVMSVITVTAPPGTRGGRYQRPSGAWSSKLARGVAQALDALRDVRLDVARPVVAVLRQVAQKIGIRTAGLQQLRRHLVHLPEAIIAEHDAQILVRVDKRARHVVEGKLQLPLYNSGFTWRG